MEKIKVPKKPIDKSLYSSWQEYDTKQLTVFVEPVAKQRPRYTRSGHVYTPDKTAKYEKLIRECWELSHEGLWTGDIVMLCDFYVPIPKSMSKKDKQKAVECELRPSKKPDIDNYIKAVMDALNEVAYWDDRQIISITANKWYATEPRVDIRLKEIRPHERKDSD